MKVDWARLSALYDQGASLPPEQRAAFLDALQGDDLPLRERLQRMLAPAQQAADEPLDQLRQAVAQALPPAAARLQPGDRLGPWELAGLLGEGGMGQVWRARRADGLYEAEAAIKLLRADIGSRELEARFARERRLLARLQHPGIAQLLDAGVDDAHGAYLVIELVVGQTLSRHVREQHLSVRARVALLAQIAQAVQAAHAQLVVHRDLKPANVLVSPEGAPKLLDFGIATLLEQEGNEITQITRLAGARMTPAYAAPEQISGEAVGTGVDVYALGVMLFELLSGFLPQGSDSMTRTQLEHAVLHREPQRFAELLRLPERTEGPGRPPDAAAAQGDLEAVCAKALRKKPEDRYPSVGALLADLQRYLASQPVSVRREDWQHRTRLWLRRNRALAISGALVLTALSGGLALALQQRQVAQQAAEDAEAVAGYMTELLAAASPDRHGGRPPSVLELLESKRAELPQRFEQQPAVKDKVLATLAATYLGMNRFDVAIPLAEQRLDAARRHFGERAPQTEDAVVNLARLHTALANRLPVVDLLEPLLPRLRERLGVEHGQTTTVRQQLLMALANLGRFDEAQALLDEEWVVTQQRFQPTDYSYHFHNQYAFVLRTEQGRLVEAERLIAALQAKQALASKEQQRFARVSERNLAQAQWRLLMDTAPRAIERAEELGTRIDALLGTGNDLHGTLRSALAEHLWQLDEPAAALEHLRRWQREQQDASRNAVAGLVRELSLLSARALSGERLTAAELEAGWRTLDAQPLVAGQRRAEGLLHLGEAALHGVPGEDGQTFLARLLDALDAPGLIALPQWRARVERLRTLHRLRAGDLPAAATAARRASQLLAALPEPQGLATYAAHLRLAHTLRLAAAPPDEVARALEQAQAARPSHLDRAMAGRTHPLDGLRQALIRGAESPVWPQGY